MSLRNACALALLFAVLCPAAAAADDGGPFWWGPAEPIAPAVTAIDAIACPSASLCVATAGQSILTSTDPTGGPAAWRVDHVDDNQFDWCRDPTICPAPPLDDIACPSPTLCLAVDHAGYVFTSTRPAEGGPSWSATRFGPSFPLAVDCASPSLCVIVGGGREAWISTDPLGGASAWRAFTIDEEPCPSLGGCGGPRSFPSVLDVACPTTNACIAVDVAGNVLSSAAPATDPGPWRAAHITSTNGACGHVLNCAVALTAIACPLPEACVAGDAAGLAWISGDPTGGAAAWTGGPLIEEIPWPVGAVACASSSRCFVAAWTRLHERPDVLRDTAWKRTQFERTVTALACLSPTRCLAGDELGAIAVGRAGPAGAQIRARLRAGLTSLRGRPARMHVTAPVPGKVVLRWWHRGRLVATGERSFGRPATRRVRLTTTRTGKRLLRRRGAVRLSVEATLERPLRASVAVRRVQTLRSHRIGSPDDGTDAPSSRSTDASISRRTAP